MVLIQILSFRVGAVIHRVQHEWLELVSAPVRLVCVAFVEALTHPETTHPVRPCSDPTWADFPAPGRPRGFTEGEEVVVGSAEERSRGEPLVARRHIPRK
jgi:hypothetical protein